MKQRKKPKAILALMLLVTTLSFSTSLAQEVIPVTGGDAAGSGGSVSYSIGQLVYQTNNGHGGSMEEGIQKPFEISVVTAISDDLGVRLSVLAYPNPTSNHLTLQVDKTNMTGLSYHLYDMQGKLLLKERITDNHTIISMGDLVPAIYFVRVVQANREMITFRIVKN